MSSGALTALWQSYAETRLAEGRRLVDLLTDVLRPRRLAGLRALDVGCGDGALSQALVDAGASVIAIDFAATRLARTRERGIRDLAAGDAQGLPFRTASFDVVLMSDLLEHLPRPDAALREAARVVRPRGIVYASLPNRLSVVNLLSDPHYNVPAVGLLPRPLGAWCVTRLFRVSDSYTVERYFSWPTVRRLFRRAGLEVHELRGGLERRIETGTAPKAPSRRWMGRLLASPRVRGLALAMLRLPILRHLIVPGWQVVATRRVAA